MLKMIIAKIGNAVIKNSHHILFAVSLGCVATIPVVTAKDTVKALNRIDGEERSKKETIKRIWTCYIPTAGITVASILAVTGTHISNQKRYASLAGAYIASKEFYDRYQSKVKEAIGEDKEKDIRQAIKDDLKENYLDVNSKKKFRVYEPYTNQTFWTTSEQLLWAEINLNKTLQTAGWVPLNMFFEMIPGAKCKKAGDKIGWQVGEDQWDWNWSYYPGVPWISVETRPYKDDNGDPMLVLVFGMNPSEPIFEEG